MMSIAVSSSGILVSRFANAFVPAREPPRYSPAYAVTYPQVADLEALLEADPRFDLLPSDQRFETILA